MPFSMNDLEQCRPWRPLLLGVPERPGGRDLYLYHTLEGRRGRGGWLCHYYDGPWPYNRHGDMFILKFEMRHRAYRHATGLPKIERHGATMLSLRFNMRHVNK